jgi:hypothetical protein
LSLSVTLRKLGHGSDVDYSHPSPRKPRVQTSSFGVQQQNIYLEKSIINDEDDRGENEVGQYMGDHPNVEGYFTMFGYWPNDIV